MGCIVNSGGGGGGVESEIGGEEDLPFPFVQTRGTVKTSGFSRGI